MNRNRELKDRWASHGLHCDTYGPGDGKSRYRFFLRPTDYFARKGLFTAVGRAAAETFAEGFIQGLAAREGQSATPINVEVTISGAVVQHVNVPEGVEVIVRDYDVHDIALGFDIRTDEHGDRYEHMRFGQEADGSEGGTEP